MTFISYDNPQKILRLISFWLNSFPRSAISLRSVMNRVSISDIDSQVAILTSSNFFIAMVSLFFLLLAPSFTYFHQDLPNLFGSFALPNPREKCIIYCLEQYILGYVVKVVSNVIFLRPCMSRFGNILKIIWSLRRSVGVYHHILDGSCRDDFPHFIMEGQKVRLHTHLLVVKF